MIRPDFVLTGGAVIFEGILACKTDFYVILLGFMILS